jgi:hypothetical protein
MIVAATAMKLSANERLSLGAIRLKIGDVTEKVTVEAVGSAVQTTSSERAAQLTSSQINMVLVRGRDVLSLLRLLPGVSNTTDPNALGELIAVGAGFRPSLPAVVRSRGGRSSGFIPP